jgi:transcription antitermination factor NusG
LSELWHVLRSKPNKEQFLAGQLESRNVEFYYPQLLVHPVNPRSSKIRPYFPGYLFVNVDGDGCASVDFRWLPGATGLVSFDSQAATVPDHLVQAIRRQVDRINAAGGEVLAGLKPGERVLIMEGPFKGYDAIFDSRISGSERVRVLLKFLRARQVPVELPTAYVQREQQR